MVEHVGDDQPPSLGGETPPVISKNKGVPVVVTYLAVGCKRKIVVYSWRDGEPQEVKVCFVFSLVVTTNGADF